MWSDDIIATPWYAAFSSWLLGLASNPRFNSVQILTIVSTLTRRSTVVVVSNSILLGRSRPTWFSPNYLTFFIYFVLA